MTERVRRAVIEAVTDTVLATPLNMALSWVILYYAFEFMWGPTITMIAQTGIMFFFAVSRKTYLRLQFEKKYGS